MKFSEMTYTRPDIDALLARCKQLAAKAADAQDGDALIQVYYEQSRAFADYTTASQLANIQMWDQDLTQISGLEAAVLADLEKIRTEGAEAAYKSCL